MANVKLGLLSFSSITAMEPLSHVRYKKLCTSTGHSYNYYSSVHPSKTTILFAHGFPYTANIWRHHIAHFEELGYGCIAPDMLGLGASDKPRNAQDFASKVMAQSMVDILSAESVDKAVVVGHDWGSLIVSRMAIYHPTRTLALILVAVPYWAPAPLYLEAVNDQTEQAFGFSIFGYWAVFMNEKHLLEEHVSPHIPMQQKLAPKALPVSANRNVETRQMHFSDCSMRKIRKCGRFVAMFSFSRIALTL